jgi:hypothetical protein
MLTSTEQPDDRLVKFLTFLLVMEFMSNVFMKR